MPTSEAAAAVAEPSSYSFVVDYSRVPDLRRLLASGREMAARRRGNTRSSLVGLAAVVLVCLAVGGAMGLAGGSGSGLGWAVGGLGLVALGLMLYAERLRNAEEAARVAGAAWYAGPREITVDAHGLDEGAGGGRVPWRLIDAVDEDGGMLVFDYRGTLLVVPVPFDPDDDDVDTVQNMLATIRAWHRGEDAGPHLR